MAEGYSELVGATPSDFGRVGIDRDTRLYWELYGKREGKPKAIVLGGGLCKIGFVAGLMRALLKHGYEVLSYDTRGLGLSTARTHELQTTSLFARDCLAVVDRVWGPTARFAYFGVSLGGMLGQELASLMLAKGNHTRVVAMFLLATGPGTFVRPPPFLRPMLMRQMVVKPLENFDDEKLARCFDTLVAGAIHSKAWLDAPVAGGQPPGALRREALRALYVKHWRRLLAYAPDELPAVVCQLTALPSHYLSPARAAAIRAAGIPITVGVTPSDSIFTPKEQRALAAALGAAVVELPTAPGHVDSLFLDTLDDVLAPAVIKAFGGK